MSADNPAPDESTPPEKTPAPEARKNKVQTLVGWVALAGVLFFGLNAILNVLGIFDIRLLFRQPVQQASLSRLESATAAPTPRQTAGDPPVRHAPANVEIRDQPPRPPPSELPEFSIRDGENYDFITDLDSETLKRLGAIQEQMGQLAKLLLEQQRAIWSLDQQAQQERQQTGAYQQRVQQELTAARQQVATLTLTVQDLEARLKRGKAAFEGNAQPSGAPVAGWKVTAISGERAWLRTPKGNAITVTAGERLKVLGTVRAVDPLRRIVVFHDGRFVR